MNISSNIYSFLLKLKNTRKKPILFLKYKLNLYLRWFKIFVNITLQYLY